MHAKLLWILPLVAVGCNRQDTDALGRIGQKLVGISQGHSQHLREKYDVHLPALNTLHDKVAQRLRWDRHLAASNLEVHVSGSDIELKGQVADDVLRQRAVALAETTEGVSSVKDSLVSGTAGN